MLCAALLSIPRSIRIETGAWALIIDVRSFWWYGVTRRLRGVRGATLGNVVLLGPRLLDKDIEHELIHIEQHQRQPLTHPFLSALETVRHGYRLNKYENEAYARAGNRYVGHKLTSLD
jgi:hypothetical protein